MNASGNVILTNRDLFILKMIFDYGGCTVDQIRRRFFPTNGARSACYSRIARLVQAQYLTSLRLPSLNGVGSGRAFLTPGPKARPILAKMLGVSRTELERVRLDSPIFIQHHQAVCDFRLSIDLTCDRSTAFTLQEFLGDHELRRMPIKVTDPKTKKVISFVPDAVFTLALRDGTEQTFIVEIDLATVSPKRCREKLRCYLVNSKNHPAPVLFVAPHYQRQGALAQWAYEEAEKLKTDPTIFWITTKDQVSEKTILEEAIWTVVGGPKAIALSRVARGTPERAVLRNQPAFVGGLAE